MRKFNRLHDSILHGKCFCHQSMKGEGRIDHMAPRLLNRRSWHPGFRMWSEVLQDSAAVEFDEDHAVEKSVT